MLSKFSSLFSTFNNRSNVDKIIKLKFQILENDYIFTLFYMVYINHAVQKNLHKRENSQE